MKINAPLEEYIRVEASNDEFISVPESQFLASQKLHDEDDYTPDEYDEVGGGD